MATSIQITLSPRAQRLLAAAPAWPVALPKAIAEAMDKRNELTTGQIQRQKLSRRGPDTLGVVTNRLRLSARPAKAVISGDVILSAIGSNVSYAGVHEFGFTGTVQVKGFTRRIFGTGRGGERATVTKVTFRRDKNGNIVERRKDRDVKVEGTQTVRAHTRRVNMPARAMFRTGIAERQANYSAALSRAVVAVLTPPAA